MASHSREWFLTFPLIISASLWWMHMPWNKTPETSPIPAALYMHDLNYYQHIPSEWYIYYTWKTYTDTLVQKTQFIFGFTLGGVSFMSLETGIMTCIHHCSMNSITVLRKILGSRTIYFCLRSPIPRLFIISSLPFPEHVLAGIVCSLSDWFVLLSNTNLRFLCVLP